MICSTRTPGLVLETCRRLVFEMASEALDPSCDLSTAERSELAVLAMAIDKEAAAVVGVAPIVEGDASVLEALALITAAAHATRRESG